MAELPSGTVTFLLTDVEGSSALWEEAPEAMRAALARHDELFRWSWPSAWASGTDVAPTCRSACSGSPARPSTFAALLAHSRAEGQI